VVNLIPYMHTSAYNNMKGGAEKASQDTARLFNAVVEYYNGSEYTVVIESELKHSRDLRAELDGMGAAIGAAWFERFDMGVAGTVRALMESHLGLMNNLYDRLRALLVAVSTEDFGESHTKVMKKIKDSSTNVALCVEALLNAATHAATDGDISGDEKAHLNDLIADTRMAVRKLATEFDASRKQYKVVAEETFGESFFVLTLSAYARMTIDYAQTLIDNPPKGVGFGEGVKAGITSTFTGLTDKFNVNFTIKHFVALTICWFWALYVDMFGGACVITAVFLMSPAICPDIQVFLNVLNAVIVSVIVGTLVFQAACGTGYGDIALPLAATLIWVLGLYGYFSGGPLLLPALVIVALTPFKWVASCPTGEISAGARALWAGMVGNVMAILFVAGCQFFLAIDRASNLAKNEMDGAFKGEKAAFTAFFDHKDASEPMGTVAGHLGTGEGYNGAAKIEPHFWRKAWNGPLYTDINKQLGQIRLDILMLWFALAGSDGKPDAVFAEFDSTPEWEAVQQDLVNTMDDAHAVVISLLESDGSFKPKDVLKAHGRTTGIDSLGEMPKLIAYLNNKLRFPKAVGDTMEDDEVCQIASAFLLLNVTIKHIAGLLTTAIKTP